MPTASHLKKPLSGELMAPKILTGLRPEAYEHPDDSAALNALRKTKGLDFLVTKLNEWGYERMARVQLAGSFLRVTEDNLPEIWAMLIAVRDRLAIPFTPDLYISNSEELNAFTTGVVNPVIVLTSMLVDSMEDEELVFVIAHEMGHIKSGHVLYYQMAELIPYIGGMLGQMTFGVGDFLMAGLQGALLHWQRTSELTADRAGLLACQNAETAFRTLMKLAGLPHKYASRANVEDFIAQARLFEAMDLSIADRVVKFLSIFGQNHPWTVMRAKELLNWIDDKGYLQVLDAPAGPCISGVEPIRRFCDRCGQQAGAKDVFCVHCGNRLLTPEYRAMGAGN